jgi:hypothetical protein
MYELAWASALLAGFWAPAAALLSKLFQPPRAAVAEQADLLADPLALIWEELAALDAARPAVKDARSGFVAFVKELRRRDLLPLDRARARLAGELLCAVGDVANLATGYKSVAARISTLHRLSQTKFNLLREESEGYAKLVTLLHPLSASASASASASSSASHEWPRPHAPTDDASAVATTVERVRALIGHFRLDPNRVIDIAIDAFLAHPRHPSAFLRRTPPRGVPLLLLYPCPLCSVSQPGVPSNFPSISSPW